MIKIVLVCAGGLSTSLMVNKMIAAAKEKELDVNIVAMGADEYEDEPIQTDVLLVAPQISFRADEFKEKYSDKIKVIDTIDKKEYGMMKGSEVLDRVIKRL